jgi:peptide/nickel transport system permease protein
MSSLSATPSPAPSALAWTRPRGGRRLPASVWIGGGVVALVVLVAVLSPVIAPYNPDAMNILNAFAPPSPAHLLGTDNFGRDLLTRLMYGAQESLGVGVIAVAISLGIGLPLGLVSGYYRSWVDTVVMRLADVFLAFPAILLAIAMVAILGPSEVNAMVAIGLVSWPTYARVVRASVLALREEPFVEAARAAGSADGRILFRHVLPNVLSPVLVIATLGIGSAIVAEASLSFLGLGAQPPTPSWGATLFTGLEYIGQDPNLSTLPGLCIFITVLGFNLLGDGLRDLLDPSSR